MHGMWWHAALSAPALLSRPAFWSFLFFLISCAATDGVISKGDFVSIDCGASEGNNSGIFPWVTDSGYTSLGLNAKSKIVEIPPYDTLRYFHDKAISKNCYVFNTTANFSYLIRASFLHGDYDNLTLLPRSFVLLFGASVWTDVTIKNASELVTHEMIARATSDTSSVCLGRNSTTDDDPFISSLEIRQLSSSQAMYSPVHEDFLMKANSRINFGQTDNSAVRFPDDEYDRIWESDLLAITGISTYNVTTNTTHEVSTAMANDSPPSKVMQTSRSPNNITANMSFNITAKFGPGQYYLAFYFAEFDNNSSTQQIMDIYIDGALGMQAFNVADPIGVYNTMELFYKNHTVNQHYTLILAPNKSSNKAPIINAAESYFLQKMGPSTFKKDVQALEEIKSSLNLSKWTGDPCLPSVYKWPWLDCDGSNGQQTRVIGLNLSNLNLRTQIPSALGDLSALTHVDLHNSSLFGSIPSSLVNLQNLTFLDLSYNNLSGEYPSELNTVANFRHDGNPFLCNGTCSTASTPTPEPSHSSRTSVGLVVGIVVAAIFTAAVLMCVLYKCNSRKKNSIFGAHSAHWPPVPVFTEISKSADYGKAIHTGGSYDIPIFSFADMQNITNNFANKVSATGGSGTLYYGVLFDGQEVVVKLLHLIKQPPLEFLYKVTPLSYVKHKNLLRPIGFCADSDHPMFIHECVQNRTLYEYLHTNKYFLDWKTRLNILQQVAQGLEHLHSSCSPSIIHGNLTSSNVHLSSGDGFLAKISDFGIHELLQNMDATSGYLDPEYSTTHKLTEKSDIYSFGVLILEVVCGCMPVDRSAPKGASNIIEWVRKQYDVSDIELIVDVSLHGTYNASTLSRVIQLALQATEGNGNERPTMAKLVLELKEANKIETGHHVAFAEPDNPDNSTDSDAPLTSAVLISNLPEKDLH